MQGVAATRQIMANTPRTLNFLPRLRRVWEKAWCLIIRLLMATGGIEGRNLWEVPWMNAGQGERRWKIKYLISNHYKLKAKSFNSKMFCVRLIYFFSGRVFLF